MSACTLPGTGWQQGDIPDSTEGVDLTMAPAADDVFSLNMNTKYSFNPLVATNHSNQLVCSLVYENMVELDNDFNVIPNIITEWSYNDAATTWNLTIDTSRTFHDGTNITSKDIRYSIERAVNSDRYSGRFRSYMGSATDGDDKLVVTVGVGDTLFIKLLNIPVIKYGTNDDTFPMGSGPYYFVIDEETKTNENTGKEYTVQTSEMLKAYEGHKDYENLQLDTIYLKEYADAESIISAFEDSYIDVVINDPTSYTNLGYASTNEIHTYATTNMHFVAFNRDEDVAMMPGFRYAMQFAFDRSYITTLLKNNAVASAIPAYPTVDYYPDELNDTLKYDLDKCLTILTNNGFIDNNDDGVLEYLGVPFTLRIILCSDSSAKAGIVNRFISDMASIGLNVEAQELTWDDYYNALTDYENFTKEQREDEDFEEIEFDMYYGEVKLRNNFDITELIQERTDSNKYSNINYTNSTGNGYETLLYNYLASSDTSRKSNYQAFCEYILTSDPYFVVIGFEKQQLITHRAAIRGLDPNAGNPLYNFTNWQIQFSTEIKTEEAEEQ